MRNDTASVLATGFITVLLIGFICVAAYTVGRPIATAEACSQPEWLVLDFLDGGPSITRVDRIMNILPAKNAGKSVTRLGMEGGMFIIVEQPLEEVGRLLCLER